MKMKSVHPKFLTLVQNQNLHVPPPETSSGSVLKVWLSFLQFCLFFHDQNSSVQVVLLERTPSQRRTADELTSSGGAVGNLTRTKETVLDL